MPDQTTTKPKIDTSKHTPPRKLRAPDEIWVPASERAVREGRTISSVTRLLLEKYGKGEIDV